MAHPAGTVRQLKRFLKGAVVFAAAVFIATLGALPATAGESVRLKKSVELNGASPANAEPEAVLVNTLVAIKNNRLDLALTEVDRVITTYPNFRLAHLIKGDLLLARAHPLKTMGGASNVPGERVADLRQEARARLTRFQNDRPVDRVPRYLVQLQPDQKYAFVVDTSKSTLYVFENHNGFARYLADYYITMGKNGIDKLREGDKKTPLGVYHVTASMPREKLAGLYGDGAFPINYPNEWDRREGRGGSGIWLHGTPYDTFSRPPLASDGCVVLTNKDLNAIRQRVQVGLTPVIISRNVEWVPLQTIANLRGELEDAMEAWKRDWESLDTNRYLSHYSRTFTSGREDYNRFAQQKRNINAGKRWTKVKLERVSIFLYPGKERLAVVTFDQDYSSSNASNRMRKRQYWFKEPAGWRIVYEGLA